MRSATLRSLLPSEPLPRDIEPSYASIDSGTTHGIAFGRNEIVTVIISREDYTKLSAAGTPLPDVVSAALYRYLHAVKRTGYIQKLERSHGWSRGPVISFKCALPKNLVHEIRDLRGRFDGHTVEAVRLFLHGESATVGDTPDQYPSSAERNQGIITTSFAALLLFMSRVFGHPFFD